MRKIGDAAYKVQLPRDCEMHPVLDHTRFLSCLPCRIHQLLRKLYSIVIWSWKDYYALREKFPTAAAWGQATSSEAEASSLNKCGKSERCIVSQVCVQHVSWSQLAIRWAQGASVREVLWFKWREP